MKHESVAWTDAPLVKVMISLSLSCQLRDVVSRGGIVYEFAS
jgi:hypothetical protein